MIKENFYTGEPISNSPPEQYISEAEAAQNASFGANFAQMQYGLGGNNYQMNPPQQNGPGYSTYPNQPQFQNTTYYNPYPNYMANYMPSPQPSPKYQYGYNPFQSFGNPIYNYQYQNQQLAYQQQMQQQRQAYIKPIDLYGNEYMPIVGYQDEISDMSRKVIQEQLEVDAINIAERTRARNNNNYNPYYGGYNYFNQPVYAQQYSQYNREVYKRIEEMKQQARQARTDFSVNLSKLAHHYLNDGVDDETIETMYTGQYIDVEQDQEMGMICAQLQFQQRYQSMVEIDPAAKYRQAALEVQKEIQSFIPPTATAKEYNDGMNLLMAKWRLDEEKSRRRSFAVDYKNDGNDSYKYLVRRKKAERIAQEQGFSLDPDAPMQIVNQVNKIKNNPEEEKKKLKKQFNESLLHNLFPDLVESGSYIDEDGALVAKCNIPDNINQEEQEYQAKKEGFINYMYSIPKIDQKPPDVLKKKEEQWDAFLGTIYTLADSTDNNTG